MYIETTGCPFPIYADPSKKLYDELGMMRTLNMGKRPEYQRKELVHIMAASFVQSLKSLKGGQALKGGDYYQVGGEFMFEPVEPCTPLGTDTDTDTDAQNPWEGKGERAMEQMEKTEEKHVTWCHRMMNTRDHAEIPELMEVLGLDGEAASGPNTKRWSKALGERKGTTLSEFSGMTLTNGRSSDESH